MASVTAAEAALVGRAEELAAVRDALAPPGAVVVLGGDAGIGKTAVWRAVLDSRPRAERCLRAAAFEGDAELGHAALADLLEPVRRDVARLPEAQREALEGAVLRRHDRPVDERTVSAALLALLRGLPGPTLVAVDDVQWLDEQSAAALGFAVRRLAGGQVRFLLTRRGDDPTTVETGLRDRLTVTRVGPLADADTHRLLADRVGGLAAGASRRVVAAAAGNPLFALELGRLVARSGDVDSLPGEIGSLLRERLDAVPESARAALLAVAASPGLSPAELLAAVGGPAVDEAVHSDLLVTDGTVRATHPLLLTAALDHADPARRRDAHARLAQVVAEPLRRARHRALAAGEPDEALAAELVAAAGSAAAHGDRRTACELAEQALRLTPPGSPHQDQRTVRLAEYCVTAGAVDRARELVAGAEAIADGPLRARAYWLRSEVELITLDECRTILELAEAAAADDPVTRSLVLSTRVGAEVRAGFSRIDEAERWAEEALALAGADPTAHRHALSELAWARAVRGGDLADLLAVERDRPGNPPVLSDSVARVAGLQRMWRGDLAGARADFAEMLQDAEGRGEAESVHVIAVQLCEVELRAGRWARIAELVAELTDTGAYQGSQLTEARFAAFVAAGRGDPAEARSHAARGLAMVGADDTARWSRFEVSRALGLVALLDGDTAAAVAVLRPMWDELRAGGFTEPGAFPVGPDLAEALVAQGEHGAAAEVASALAAVADHPWAAASALRARGHLAAAGAAGGDPADLFGEAAAAYDAAGFAFDRARCLVHGGAALRARRRVRDARAVLEDAVALLEALDSPGWARWASAELARLGGRRAAGSALTDAEDQVARLVAQGRRNREVAAELFISVSTVEATLSRVYAKLGVRSRTELASRLPAARPRDLGVGGAGP